MTENELALFLNAAIGLCAAMAVLNLLRFRKRGASAVAMSLAFLAMGLTIHGYIRHWQTPWLILGGMAVFSLLVVDFVLRLPRPKDEPSERGSKR